MNKQREHLVTKTRYMWGLQCDARQWNGTNDPMPRVEALPGTPLGQGNKVDSVARGLWPNGVLVAHQYFETQQAVRRTKQLIRQGATAIFQAALLYKKDMAWVDCLERLPDGGWRLNEVKSSTRVKPEHLEELAFQARIVAANDLELCEVHLVHINPQYVRNGELDLNELFVREDVTADIIPLLDGLTEKIAHAHKVIALPEAPKVRPGRHCSKPYDCEFWERCTATKPADWIYYIPRLSEAVFNKLELAGIESMRGIP
jgi:hypothetical protein